MEGTTAAASVDIRAFLTALTGAVSVGDVVTLLASVVGIGFSFILMWFGIRKAWNMFTKALTKGKASI